MGSAADTSLKIGTPRVSHSSDMRATYVKDPFENEEGRLCDKFYFDKNSHLVRLEDVFSFQILPDISLNILCLHEI
jgi:hypothetical protein